MVTVTALVHVMSVWGWRWYSFVNIISVQLYISTVFTP